MAKMSDDEDYDISDADSTADYDAAKSDAESSGPEEYEESGSDASTNGMERSLPSR